jgi:hypothetical protein
MLFVVFALILAAELGAYAGRIASSTFELNLNICTAILAITFWIGCKQYAGLKNRLVAHFYRDGVAYFVGIAGKISSHIVDPGLISAPSSCFRWKPSL